MMASISSDGRGAFPPDRPASFLIVDPSKMIDDAMAKTMLSQQTSLRITKDLQQAADEMSQFPSNHRSVVIYLEDVNQLLKTVVNSTESPSVTYVILMGDKAEKERTLADLFDAERPH